MDGREAARRLTGPPPGERAREATADEAPGDLAPSYRWWREHGRGWFAEYEARKQRQVLYHIEELMLAEYFAHHAPARVLEFGCGVGRHLRYLTQIPGIEAYGFDQSPTMAAECAHWADAEWIAERVRVGEPGGRLPYADGEFDIVFTAEVLVHVRPEDVRGVARELLRVCRGHLLHLETSAEYELCETAHDGCWQHDLVTLYRELGYESEALEPGYAAHTPVRVVVASAPRFTWSPVVLALYRRLEQDMDGGQAALREQVARLEAASTAVQEELDRARARCAELERLLAESRAGLAASEGRATELERQRAEDKARVTALLLERERFLAGLYRHIRR